MLLSSRSRKLPGYRHCEHSHSATQTMTSCHPMRRLRYCGNTDVAVYKPAFAAWSWVFFIAGRPNPRDCIYLRNLLNANMDNKLVNLVFGPGLLERLPGGVRRRAQPSSSSISKTSNAGPCLRQQKNIRQADLIADRTSANPIQTTLPSYQASQHEQHAQELRNQHAISQARTDEYSARERHLRERQNDVTNREIARLQKQVEELTNANQKLVAQYRRDDARYEHELERSFVGLERPSSIPPREGAMSFEVDGTRPQVCVDEQDRGSSHRKKGPAAATPPAYNPINAIASPVNRSKSVLPQNSSSRTAASAAATTAPIQPSASSTAQHEWGHLPGIDDDKFYSKPNDVVDRCLPRDWDDARFLERLKEYDAYMKGCGLGPYKGRWRGLLRG